MVLDSVRRSCLAEARLQWSILLTGTEEYERHNERFREALAKGELMLADLRKHPDDTLVTQEAYDAALRACRKHAAEVWLKELQGGVGDYDDLLARFQHEVEKGKFSLAEFGMSDAQITMLKQLYR